MDLFVLMNPLELLATLAKTIMRLSEEYDWGSDANTWDCINKAGVTFIEMERNILKLATFVIISTTKFDIF